MKRRPNVATFCPFCLPLFPLYRFDQVLLIALIHRVNRPLPIALIPSSPSSCLYMTWLVPLPFLSISSINPFQPILLFFRCRLISAIAPYLDV